MDNRLKLEGALRQWVSGTDLPIRPKSVRVRTFEDALGQEGWEVVLTLPKPAGNRWNRDDLFRTRREVAARLDAEVATIDCFLPGTTLVTVTSDEADDEDLALPDVPEEGEGPAQVTEDVEQQGD